MFVSSSVDIYYPDENSTCIRMQATINISVIATFDPPQAVQFPLENYTILNSSHCSNGSVTAVLNIQTSDGIQLLFLFVEDGTRGVQMNSQILFVPNHLFSNFTQDNETVLLNEQKPKGLPPPDRAYSCSQDDAILMKTSERENVAYSGVIDLIYIQIQAFNLNGSNFGPVEDCGQSVISTPIPATPTPGVPPTNMYILESIDGMKCIVMNTGIEFTIPYTTASGAKSTKVIGVPSSAIVKSGTCTDFGSTAQIALSFYGDWILSLLFTSQNNQLKQIGVAADNQYTLYSITLTYSLSKTLFPDSKDLKIDTTVSVRLDPPQFGTTLGYSYQCATKSTYDIDHGVDISFVNLQYKAFNSDNTTTFDPSKVIKCNQPSPSSPDNSGLSPGVIAVIVIIVVAVVLAAGGVVFFRVRRRHTPYDQVN
ncbi:hypothetical protein FSP39_003650 [Pinctada imbricata]|uniref:Lysosome-associated membrane glycoprotein 5 n=1 Tax=Pinctada imbricata TaxID=66713 RepID=A0AA88XZ20_PINIB|nr:hypothetical protein FSP39_003650 [Pinctada imbricata]